MLIVMSEKCKGVRNESRKVIRQVYTGVGRESKVGKRQVTLGCEAL